MSSNVWLWFLFIIFDLHSFFFIFIFSVFFHSYADFVVYFHFKYFHNCNWYLKEEKRGRLATKNERNYTIVKRCSFSLSLSLLSLSLFLFSIAIDLLFECLVSKFELILCLGFGICISFCMCFSLPVISLIQFFSTDLRYQFKRKQLHYCLFHSFSTSLFTSLCDHKCFFFLDEHDLRELHFNSIDWVCEYVW